jgi:nitrite reductase/ring-hydroxylating ferredoxin subunit
MTHDRDVPALTRRQFVVGTVALGGAAALGLVGCGASGPSGPPPTPNRWIPISTAGLVAGEPRWIEFDTTPGVPGAPPTPAGTPADSLPPTRGGAWLVLEADGTVVAFVPNCTHQLCFYDWETASARFSCRCHEAFFEVDGAVISGPPPWRRYGDAAGRPDTIEIGWVDQAEARPPVWSESSADPLCPRLCPSMDGIVTAASDNVDGAGLRLTAALDRSASESRCRRRVASRGTAAYR